MKEISQKLNELIGIVEDKKKSLDQREANLIEVAKVLAKKETELIDRVKELNAKEYKIQGITNIAEFKQKAEELMARASKEMEALTKARTDFEKQKQTENLRLTNLDKELKLREDDNAKTRLNMEAEVKARVQKILAGVNQWAGGK